MNPLKTGRDYLQSQSSNLPDVIMVAWNISSQCNLACKHCYLGDIKGYGFMSEQELNRIVSQIASLNIKAVFLAGGEPLLIKNIEEVVCKLTNQGVSVFINTNGLLLSDKRIDSLLDAKITGVIIGFDGISKQIYELIRGKNTYRKALMGLQTAIKKGLYVESDFTLNSLNRHELLSLPSWGDELEINRITIKRYVPRPDSEFDLKLRLTPKQLKEAYYNFLDAFPYPSQRNGCKIYAHDPLFLVAKAEKGLLKKEDILREDCNAGGYTRGWIGISSKGNVQPCPVITEKELGNILTEDLRNIIKHPQMGIVRDNIPSVCQECPSVSYCRGGCRATKIRMVVGLDSPDPCCWRAFDGNKQQIGSD